MKRLLLATLIILFPALAWAATCTCPAGKTCNVQGADADWSGGCGAGAGAGDDLVIASGGILSLNSSNTVNTIEVDSGGTMNCMHDTTARTITCDNTKLGPRGGTWSAWIWIRSGATINCAGSTGVEGEDITFAFTGTVPANGANFFIGDSIINSINTTTDSVVNLRGLRRSSGSVWAGNTSIDNFAQGTTTTDFVYCADLIGGLGDVAANDTAVFTSGRMMDYWCKVTNVTPNTAECPNTACAGGQCDVQLDCNNSGRAYLSVTKVSNLGGPSRHATPDDSDADGTADNGILYPSNGDAIELFKMARIHGGGDEAAGGTNAMTLGARILFGAEQANIRYLEMDDLTSDPITSSCTAVSCTGSSSIHMELTLPTNSEGDGISFVNIHDWGSTQATEINATDHTEDVRSNYPLVRSHWYMHDPDQDIPSTCTCGSDKIGFGEVLTVDDGTNMTHNGSIVNGMHIARVYGTPYAVSGPQFPGSSPQWTGLQFNRFLIHDWPADSTFGFPAPSFYISDGGNTQINGLTIWDTGNSSLKTSALLMAPRTNNTMPPSLNSVRVSNLYAVNVDTNSTVYTGDSVVDMTANVTGSDGVCDTGSTHLCTVGNIGVACSVNADCNTYTGYSIDTATNRLSNSYVANTVGNSVRGGATYFSMFLDDSLADGGTCNTNTQKTIMLDPVDAIGNVISQSNSVSCYNSGIAWLEIGVVDSTPFTTRTRKIISNVVSGMKTMTSYPPVAVKLNASSIAINGDIDLYNNVFDVGQAATTPGDEYGVHYACNDSSCNAKLTGYYNFIMGSKYRGVRFSNSGTATQDFDYNIFYRIGSGPSYNTLSTFYDGESNIHAHDAINNNQDFFLDPSTSLYTLNCRSSYRTASGAGQSIGPLRYGIQSFEYFHPAALATMNSIATKGHFDWRDCSGVYQDDIPRKLLVNGTIPQTFMGGISLAGDKFFSSINTVTTTSSTITIPGASALRTLNGIRVRAPNTNTAPVYIYDGATATTSHTPVNPGDYMELPFHNATIAAVAGSGTQTLIVVGLYQTK